jgi:hypothetical protein
MLDTYQSLAGLALAEFGDIVTNSQMIGGTPADSNKLRVIFKDESVPDIWLSKDGEYAYHWEHRRQSGMIYRWDNAPHHPEASTFPKHFHHGDETAMTGSELSSDFPIALRDVLRFVRPCLTK